MLKLLITLMMLVGAGAVAAQEDLPLVENISYDADVSDTISNEAVYDWWLIDVLEGDIIVATMTSTSALEPLIGILDPGGNLMGRTEDGTPGGSVTLEYTAPEDGLYTLVATRVGNEKGTTTGSYDLLVRRANAPTERINPYQQVIFRCADYEVTNVVSLEFADDSAEFYRISVYGLDGFQPVIRVLLSTPDVEDCSRDPLGMEGDVVTLPDGETMTVAPAETEPPTARLGIGGADEGGVVSLTIGSKDGAAGRYIAVIEGFSITPANDTDFVLVGQGPHATDLPLLVYMVSDKATRLDPAMVSNDEHAVADFAVVCDDAGRRGCADVPSVNGLFIELMNVSESVVEIKGSRFDAGAVFPLGDPQRLHSLELSSFSGNTEGGYALVLMGSLD